MPAYTMRRVAKRHVVPASMSMSQTGEAIRPPQREPRDCLSARGRRHQIPPHGRG
uniref:Uncharacterized protein n=1 Tax=uncultured marine virus TaxID=186617 RepID=A0A0F7L916_9VIRU|nr:hypothetical protein [uncultured marine virus]